MMGDQVYTWFVWPAEVLNSLSWWFNHTQTAFPVDKTKSLVFVDMQLANPVSDVHRYKCIFECKLLISDSHYSNVS